MSLALLAVGSYLFGSLPFGYLVGRIRGINLFQAGSGNIGATNVGRVLGWPLGLFVFGLDFLKGALPVLAAGAWIDPPTAWAKVIAAAAALLGHLFPIFLGFRGGKGVATGAGTVCVLAPIPAAYALAIWVLTLLATRFVSLASILAAVALAGIRIVMTRDPWNFAANPITAYCLAGAVLVIAKHRSNLVRLRRGNENQIGDTVMRQVLLRVLHLLAVGLWFGGAGFFNFAVAPSLFRTFDEVTRTAPSDRTAHQPLGFPGGVGHEQLGKALAGAAVGPIFPIYFAMMTVCGTMALITAWIWRREFPEGRVHYFRFLVALMALATVLAGWPISHVVAALREARFSADQSIVDTAKPAFELWHVISLLLSFVTVILAGLLLIQAAWLPRKTESSPLAPSTM